MIKKLAKARTGEENHVTHRGVANKCLYFILTILAGVILSLVLRNVGTLIVNEDTGVVFSSQIGAITGVSSGVLMLIVPFIALLIRRTSAVIGTIYCICFGNFIGFAATAIDEYRAEITIAAALTVLVCLALTLLYRSGRFTVTSKMRNIVYTSLIVFFMGSAGLVISNFIPGLHFIPEVFLGYGIIGIAAAVFGVILAAAFFLVDLDNVAKAEEAQLAKEYEWFCALSIMFSVVWLFLRLWRLVGLASNKK